jgi:hypothetical protein
MIRQSFKIIPLIILLAACGDDASSTCSSDDGSDCADSCGAGTVLDGGTCVSACGPGQYWDGTDCAMGEDCQAGTVRDESTGACRPECTKNERWDGTECVATGCGTGTVLDEASGNCVPDDDLCGPGSELDGGVCTSSRECAPGTVEQDGECIPEPDTDTGTDSDPGPSIDVNESDVDGTAATFDVPDEGESIVLGGNVDEPQDSNVDGYTETDWDTFIFTATAGQYLRLSAGSTGSARPAMVISSTALDEDKYPVYRRYSMDTGDGPAVREIYLPAAGDYTIQVTEYNNFLTDVFGAGFVPVGGDDFDYHITVENLGAPTPTSISSYPDSTTGDFTDGALGFFNLPGLALQDVYELALGADPPEGVVSNLSPSLMLLDPTGAIRGESHKGSGETATVLFSVTTAGDHLLVRDFMMTTGPQHRFALQIDKPTVVNCSDGSCTGGALVAQEKRFVQVDLNAGDLFVFQGNIPSDATENLGITFYDHEMTLISDASAGPTWVRWVARYYSAATTIYLVLNGWSEEAVPSYGFEVIREPITAAVSGVQQTAVPVIDMPLGTMMDGGFLRVDGTAGQFVAATGITVNTSPPDWLEQAHRFHQTNDSLSIIGPPTDINDADLAAATLPVAQLPEDGTYLHSLGDGADAANIVGGSYDITLQALNVTDLGTPSSTTPVSTTGAALDSAAGLALFTFTGTMDTPYTVQLTTAGTELQAEVFVLANGWKSGITWYWSATSHGLGMFASGTAASAGAPVNVAATAPLDGSVYVVVRQTGAATTDTFDLTISE